MSYLREIISACERKENNVIFLAMRRTQDDLLLYLVNFKLGINLRIFIIIDLIIIKLFEVCLIIFSLKEKEVFT